MEKGKDRQVMIKGLSRSLVIGALFLCVVLSAIHVHGTKRLITIAVFPCTDGVTALKRFKPLIAYLKKETGFDIKLVVPTDSTEFELGLKKGNIDFAFQSAQAYMQFARLYDNGALLRALTGKGATTHSGVVIVKKERGIEKVADLRGKVVLFGPKHSATRWTEAKLLFEENGLDIDKDLKAYSNGQCCEDIAFSVLFGGVDAGIICDHFLDEHRDRMRQRGLDPEQLTIIGKTRLVPTRIFAPRRDVGSNTVNAVNQALLKLNKTPPLHERILRDSELGGFQKWQAEGRGERGDAKGSIRPAPIRSDASGLTF